MAKTPLAKSANVGVVVPPDYTPPAEPKPPNKAELDQKRADIKAAVQAIAEGAPRPFRYEKIYHELRNQGIDMKWLRGEIMFLISEVDKTINPDDFVFENGPGKEGNPK